MMTLYGFDRQPAEDAHAFDLFGFVQLCWLWIEIARLKAELAAVHEHPRWVRG